MEGGSGTTESCDIDKKKSKYLRPFVMSGKALHLVDLSENLTSGTLKMYIDFHLIFIIRALVFLLII